MRLIGSASSGAAGRCIAGRSQRSSSRRGKWLVDGISVVSKNLEEVRTGRWALNQGRVTTARPLGSAFLAGSAVGVSVVGQDAGVRVVPVTGSPHRADHRERGLVSLSARCGAVRCPAERQRQRQRHGVPGRVPGARYLACAATSARSGRYFRPPVAA